jgi:hypothetical protein
MQSWLFQFRIETTPWHFWVPHTNAPIGKEGLTVQAGQIELGFPGENSLLLHNGD